MNRTSAVIASVLWVIGCKDPDTKDVATDECTELPTEPCDPSETGETGGDDTATGDDTGGPKEIGPDECVHNIHEGVLGAYRMQCEGELFTTLEFKLPFGHDCESALGADFCSQHHVFGPPHDTYAAPDVMACCGEAWDDQYTDVYLQHCTYDLIQQVCVSLAKRLESHILDGTFGKHAGQAAALQVWVAENYETCFQSLRLNDSNPELSALESHWKIPNDSAWKAIDGLVLRIDAGTEASGVIRPESTLDWIPCHGANGNNDEVFEDVTGPNGGIVAGVDLVNPVDGELVGPTIFGGTVSASSTFEAFCLPHGCATAIFSYDRDDTAFTLEDLNLYTGSFFVTNGVSGVTVERARVELWGQAGGYAIQDLDGRLLGYVIPPGGARFLLAGVADGQHNRFIGSNATDIDISRVGEGWIIHSFAIVYQDGSGNDWTLTLGESTWR